MCNLYSITRSQEAMRCLFAVAEDRIGNLPPMPGVFPDMVAPIVRGADAERRLAEMPPILPLATPITALEPVSLRAVWRRAAGEQDAEDADEGERRAGSRASEGK